MPQEKKEVLAASPKVGVELIAVANILGGLDVEEASGVAKVFHSYSRLTKLEGEPELDVTKFLRYKLLAPACDELNAAVAAKVGVSKEVLYAALEKGDNNELIKKANAVLNSPEFAKEQAAKTKELLEKSRMVIEKGVEAGFYVGADGKRYDADFHAIKLNHKSLDGGKCPDGCPMAAATEIYNKPAESQAVKGNAK